MSATARFRGFDVTARQHHYVPQCYLKGFVRRREKPKLFCVDAKERRTFNTAPVNVAVERDFHRVDIEGLSLDAFENALSGFEGELSQALARIIATRSIQNESDRAYLFNFIGLMATKNPRLREIMRASREQTTKTIMSMATATPERWAAHVRRAKDAGYIENDANDDYEQMRNFIENDEYKIDVSPAAHLATELKIFDRILPLVFHRKWMLFRAPPNVTGFVTSDHPMCLMWSDPKLHGGFYPPGLGLKGTQLLFPISNELAAIGAFEMHEQEVDADELIMAQINGSIILHATRQIYARDNTFLYKMQHHAKIMYGADLINDRCLRPSAKHQRKTGFRDARIP
jgi:hypothetical protein